jgi:hypothetical protein
MQGTDPAVLEPGGEKRDSKLSSRTILAAASVVWSFALIVIAAGRYQGDVRGFLCLGDGVSHPPVLATAPRSGPDGYDGQFYAALATDPFLRDRDTVSTLDNPAFRGSRIAVPLLSWLLAATSPSRAVYAYIIVCWGLGIIAVYLAARMLGQDGRSPLWVLLLIPSAGLAASLFRATPDAATATLILASLFFHRKDRFAAALACGVAAVLSREIAVILAFALALDELRRKRLLRAAAYLAAPIGAWLAWKIYMQIWIGSGFTAGERLFGFPFSWIVRKVGEAFRGTGAPPSMEIPGLVALAATLVGFIAVITKPKRWTALEFTFLGFGALLPVLSYSVFVEAWGYVRILMVLPFLAAVVAERQTEAWRRWLLRSIVIAYAVVGLIMIGGELQAARARRNPGPVAQTSIPAAPWK